MDRLITIPNVISAIRLCLIPVFLYLLFGVEEEYQAAWLLLALGCTDWIDGYIARHFNQVSTVGKVLDPSVDRLLLGTAAISLIAIDAVPLWFGLIALGREVIVGVAGILLGLLGATRIDVRFVGKTGAFLLMASFPLFLVDHSGGAGSGAAHWLAYLCGIPGLILNWYSVPMYGRLAVEAWKKGHRFPRSGG